MESFELLDLEKIILKALIVGGEETRAFILRKFKTTHFTVINPIFDLIQQELAVGNATLVNLDSLASHPNLDTPSKGLVAGLAHVPTLLSAEQLSQVGIPLFEAYGKEHLLELVKPTIEALQQDDLTSDEATSRLLTDLERHQSELKTELQENVALGHDTNLATTQARVLSPITGRFLKSGIPAIDRKIGGFTRGDLIILAAPSSHGKTLMMVQLLNDMLFNHPNQNASALYVTMEVQDFTVTHRLLAVRTGIPLSLVRQVTQDEEMATEYVADKPMKLAEIAKIRERCGAELAVLDENLRSKKRKLEIKPRGQFTTADLLKELAIYPYDIIILDYLNLMSGNGEADWLRLSNITRDLKNIATSKDNIIISAQQLDEITKDVRYSKAVREHCDILLTWELSKEVLEANGGLVEMKVKKGRNIGIFSFPMMIDLTTQTAKDPGDASDDASWGLGNLGPSGFGGSSFGGGASSTFLP